MGENSLTTANTEATEFTKERVISNRWAQMDTDKGDCEGREGAKGNAKRK